MTTLEKIHQSATKEFLKKGFRQASLRTIVRNAGLTTGAFYGYYSSKEALFAALVEPCAATVMKKFMEAQEAFFELEQQVQPEHLGVESGECVTWMMEYIYDNYDTFKLIFCCSDGTSYEKFLHNMVEIEVESTYRFIQNMESIGKKIPNIDRHLIHIITSGMFGGLAEIVIHDMPREDAQIYVGQLQEFYTAGWKKILEV